MKELAAWLGLIPPESEPTSRRPSGRASVSSTQEHVVERDGYQLRLKTNPRARRISLRIDSRTGDVIAVAPSVRHLNEALAFADSRRDWILRHKASHLSSQGIAPGMAIPYRGREIQLIQAPGHVTPKLSVDGLSLIVTGEDRLFARRVLRFLSKEAQIAAQTEVTAYAARLGVGDVSVRIFDAAGRWGSCTPSRKAIRIGWRLIMAPPHIFSYVCAHEAAHLRHPDHSPRFWAEVQGLFGDHKAARQWLKAHGASLHRIGA